MEKKENVKKLLDLLDKIKVTDSNKDSIEEIRDLLVDGNIASALNKIENLKAENALKLRLPNEKAKETEDLEEEPDDIINTEEDLEDETSEEEKYPKILQDNELEKKYISLLLLNPKSISMYYFLYEDCMFENQKFLNIYKSILFTEGANYSSEIAKKDFNFPKETKESAVLKLKLRKEVEGKKIDFEKTYMELKKLFILRKYYNKIPIKDTQEKIAEIRI